MSWHAKVYVVLKPSVMDPQGSTVQRALHQMGYSAIENLRIGKFIEVNFDQALQEQEVHKQLNEICDKLLANPNIETYQFQN
jgi:phosphoribosylformylglycinamidine synthase